MQILLSVLTMAFLISSCGPTPRTGFEADSSSSNGVTSLDPGYGRVLRDNPIILANDSNLAANVDLSRFVGSQVFITNNQYLQAPCTDIASCFSVKQERNSNYTSSVSDRWAYNPNSDEFLESHTFYHINTIVDRYHSIIDLAINRTADPSLSYNSSLPQTSLTKKYGHWYAEDRAPFDPTDPNKMVPKELLAYSTCELKGNAYFDYANFILCFGVDPDNQGLKFSQDPTIIYHEMGHGLMQIMLNTRNTVAQTLDRVSLGTSSYDEAGALGEGIGDYFSYMINSRTHFAEWAAGRFYNLSRPLSENDPIHGAGISTLPQERLAYPDYINHDPNNQTTPIEGIHITGMITSHYLVALTEDLKNQCSFNQETAVNEIIFLITETLAELGDLTSAGNDNFASLGNNGINLNSTNSKEWATIANPINYRKFFQTFAKYLLAHTKESGFNCAKTYSQDRIEQLLDNYGLLLFKRYNEDLNDFADINLDSIPDGQTSTDTQVSGINRVKTLLINKDLIKLDDRTGKSKGFIFDNRSDISSIIASLKSVGQVAQTSSLIPDDLPYNNSNGKISPGEIVGVALNLYNNSNSPMAGIQVLANDWDQGKGQHLKCVDTDVSGDFQNSECTLQTPAALSPCNNLGDSWPLASEGAADLSYEGANTVTYLNTTSTYAPGDCQHTSRTNGGSQSIYYTTTSGTQNMTISEVMAPVCWVQVLQADATKWAGQETLRSNIGLSKTKCLSGSTNTNDCFIKAIRGAEVANYSKIDGNKNWSETIYPDGGPKYESGNLFLFEVNPWTPPGTTFNCRLRVRFSNCADCFNKDASGSYLDFLDYEYASADPFKIINFNFTVID